MTIVFGIVVEIGDDDDDAAAVQELLEVVERLGEIRARAAFGLFDGVQDAHELALARGGRRRS